MRLNAKSKFDLEGGGESSCCGFCYCSKKQKRICCFLIWLPVIIVFVLFAAVLIKGLTVQDTFERMELSQEEIALINPNNETIIAWAKKLGGAIKFPTVSRNKTDQNMQDLENLHEYLNSISYHFFL